VGAVTLDPILLLTVAAVLAIAGALLWKYPIQIAVAAVVIAIALDLLLGVYGIELGINVYADDIACLVLLSAGVCVALRTTRFSPGRCWPVFALFALVLINFARGASEFGLKAAGNGSRSLTYLIVPSVTVALLRPALRVTPQHLALWLTVLGCVLAIVAGCRWAGTLPVPEQVLDEAGNRAVVRVLPAEFTHLIGQALFAIAALQLIRGVRWWKVGIAGMLATITVALQHRSVWAATVVGLMWLAAGSFRSSQKRWFQLVGTTCIALSLAAMTLSATGGIDRVELLVRTNLNETQQQDSTWTWRVGGFAEATDRLFSSDTSEILFGPPSGRDLGSDVGMASVSIHSRYVETLAHYGILGGVLLLIWLVAVARKVGGGWVRGRSWEGRPMSVETAFLQALLLSQLTYFVAYSGGLTQGEVIGLIWLTATADTERVHESVLNPRAARRNAYLIAQS
jgi:hypothetical protein